MRQQKNYYLDESVISYIEQYAKEKKLKPSLALTQIVKEHAKQNNELLEQIKQAVKEVVQEDLNRIRAGTNLADRNSRMILEFMNHYFIVNTFKELITTDKFKSPGIIEAEQVVKKQIAEARLKKLEWEQKKQLNQ
ncbi:hypothetical protein [Bacillus smithii]|uniref:hypothetical protein n=1 Tax=Bacillus smithii TaxID=1479 RepID=UPI002E1B9F45|nr:hypothetical protein [Bacillus smithii]MED4928449.1 hypothetical protein [Bacillus smithii]